MEDGGKAAERKSCCVSYRRPLCALIFFCTFMILYGLNLTDNSSSWRDQLWSHYLNTTAQIRLQNSTLKQLLSTFSRERTTTKMAPVTEETLLPPPPPPPPEYKSPGPYLVEYPYKYSYIINEPTRCKELNPFLVLVVPVAPQNKADRQIIRDTWGVPKVGDKNVALFFLLGLGNVDTKELLEESQHFKDIIQSDFVDCYKNLTIKTMVMMEWLDAHCRQASYAMKIDSDMFLNLPKLMTMLQNTPKSNYLTGLVERAAIVHRYTQSKWYVPFHVFGDILYPPYVLGLGYVLSLDMPKKLVKASREVKALYIEDVYLGMCMRHIGLSPSDPPIPGAFHVFPVPYNRCQFSKIIATTVDQHTDRRKLWADFTKPGPYC